MKRGIVLLTIVTSIIVLYACKKEEPNVTVYDPTPHTIALPAYVKNYVGDMPVPADNPLTDEGVALGRMLFYEKMLSDNMTLSCASCHKQENAFDDPPSIQRGDSRGIW